MSIVGSVSNMFNLTGTNNSLKAMFIKEGETLLNATRKCEELWKEMQGADFRKEGLLNEKNIQLIYEKKKIIISDLLRITNAEDFLDVFDDDQDGFLNEDEQIMVFTLIKERIQVIAEELCLLKRYEIYRDLMKEVRGVEVLINKYQNELRQHVHTKQLKEYINIGEEMQHEFDLGWDNVFEKYEKDKNNKLNSQKRDLDKFNELIYEKELNKINNIKLKQNNKIKLLENQERLVAINERVEEAANFRNELKLVQRHDEIRLEKTKEEQIKNLQNKLDKYKKKEIKNKRDRLELDKFNYLIEQNKETDILSKQINLHIKDIERIQKSISSQYIDKGDKNDELKRDKDRQRTSNQAIAAFKSIKAYSSNTQTNNHDLAKALLNLPSKSLTLNSSMESTGMSKISTMKKNIIALKFMIKSFKLTRFDINSEFGSIKFANVKHDVNSVKNDNNLKKKIRKLLEQRKYKDEIFIPPTEYYDDKLNLVVDAKNYREILPKLIDTKSAVTSSI